MNIPLNNLRAHYQVLCDDVQRALHTQLGDGQRLGRMRNEVLRFYQAAEVHRQSFPAEEWVTLDQSVKTMTALLDQACFQVSDTPDGEPLVVVERVRTGKRGRPKIEIRPEFLQEASRFRGPKGIGEALDVAARTVRRRQLEYGLASPAPPLFETRENEDGTVTRHRNHPPPREQSLDDQSLDMHLHDVLQRFPNFGQVMIHGALVGHGEDVTGRRIAQSYVRVHGAPTPFGDRRIERRVYKVAGPNSLWHHDGQHGLIKYKIVFHGFIDGATRVVTALEANNNNRASTVRDVFLEATDRWGIPKRIRGDHGTENVLVAAWMVDNRGPGTYIFGRSVHNTRIERLWYDVTRAFGQKWKNFFLDLEMHCGFNPQDPRHLWLLHHLFLAAINDDAKEFVQAWNYHNVDLDTERRQAPFELFMFRTLEAGPRGIVQQVVPEEEEDIGDPATYGIDWEVADDPELMRHLLENNPHEEQDNTEAAQNLPPRMNEVICEAPEAPLPEELVALMDRALTERVDLGTLDMGIRRLIWQEALNIFLHLCAQLRATD